MSIELPEPCLVLLVGISGCGKSTFARRHFARTEVLSSDECRALVADDPADQTATSDAFAVLRLILDKRLKRRRLSVVDATSLEHKARKPYLALARKYDLPAVAVVLDLPFEVCLGRDRDRARDRVGEDVLRRQRAQLERGLHRLDDEGYRDVHVLRTLQQVAGVSVLRAPLEVVGNAGSSDGDPAATAQAQSPRNSGASG